MAKIHDDRDPAVSPPRDVGVRRRRLLTSGTLIAAITGVSTVSGMESDRAYAATVDEFIPLAEKGMASGVATLDADARIPASQLPDLSALIGEVAAPLQANSLSATAHTLTDIALAKAAPDLPKVTTPTYDGSGTAVHPSVYFDPDGWNGWEYWMAMTPYPNADNQKENPSVVVSHDGTTWQVPAGLVNPLATAPGAAVGYHSDPYLTVANGMMYLFWRSWLGREIIFYRTSIDGVTWSPAVTEWSYDPVSYRLMSPSFIRTREGWTMYAVDIRSTPFKVVRSTVDKLGGVWSSLDTVTLTGTAPQPWHIDVHRVGGEWQMLMVDTDSGGGDLWAAVSKDGLNFTLSPSKLLARGTGWNSRYYKSCFLPTVKGGLSGWDMWVGGSGFNAGGSIIGRTFVSLTPEPASVSMVQNLEKSLQLLQAVNKLYPWIAADTFNREDGAITTATTGQTWAGTGGTFAVTRRMASPTAEVGGRLVLDTGSVDHHVSVQSLGATATHQSWVIARYVDVDNYLRFGVLPSPNPAAAALAFQHIKAGAAVNIPFASGTSVPNAGIDIGIKCVGNQVTPYLDGVALGTYTTEAIAGTRGGFQAQNVAAGFRNFTARIP